ncbi:general substrate transporter [Amylocystis lapponica]|nr:general substrate transporter [Amylocystis lapponica]
MASSIASSRNNHDSSAMREKEQPFAAMPSMRGRRLTAALAFVAGTGFTCSASYDQGVMSALLSANQFEKVFPQTVANGVDDANHATLQSFVVAIYEIGCLIGALSNLWIGDKLGRRKTIFLGGAIMIVGAILQASSFGYAQFVVARIVTGFGNGLNTSTVPSYHAECSPAAKRGSFIMIEGSLITFGIMISYWAKGSSAQWRVPIALQILLAIVMALAVISALEDNHTPASRPADFHGIRETIAVESGGGKPLRSSLREVFTNGRSQNFHRTCLGVVNQCFQQISGITSLHSNYATLLFQRLGLGDVDSRIIAAANGTEYFLASLIAIFIIDRIGRRPLMLFGAIGRRSRCIDNSATQIVSAVLLFVFNSFFAIGWLGMTWLYPAEIVGLQIRAPANAFSTASNWIFNFMVVMVTGPAFNNISWRTYIVFASLNAFIVPVVYFFFPETAGRSLEDMDVIFAIAYNEGVSPVGVSFRKISPRLGRPRLMRSWAWIPAAASRRARRGEKEKEKEKDWSAARSA